MTATVINSLNNREVIIFQFDKGHGITFPSSIVNFSHPDGIDQHVNQVVLISDKNDRNDKIFYALHQIKRDTAIEFGQTCQNSEELSFREAVQFVQYYLDLGKVCHFYSDPRFDPNEFEEFVQVD